MDEKKTQNRNLADRLNLRISDIKNLLNQFFKPEITYKADGSPVTKLDLALSQLIEDVMTKHYSEFNFYSEENFTQWKFPLAAVDPLDGTREYIAGRSEWAISVGLFESENFEGDGWICNPVTDETYSQGIAFEFQTKSIYCGEVSRSEWEKGLFKNISAENFKITPMGSIAYKLGRLSQGKMDFVVSLRPKNIWDIAGGTLLIKQSGMKFYSQGKEVKTVQQLYQSPLIWCHPSIFPELSKLFP